MTELVVSVGSAKAVKNSKTMNKAFSKASSELKSVMGKAKKVVSTVSDEARELSRAARQATRKQLAKFRRPRRTVSRIDLEGLLEERGIPSTLNKEQRAACDAAGLEMKYKPSEAEFEKAIESLKEKSKCQINVPQKVYDSIKGSPNYPNGFIARRSGTKKYNINDHMKEFLRSYESGKWYKVYKDGYDAYQNKVSIHYFQSPSGKVFNVKVKSGWSNP